MGDGMIFTAFFRALGQIGDPRFRRVFFLGIGLALGLLIAAALGFGWLMQALVGDSLTLPWIGEITWLDNLASWGGIVLIFGLSVFLMIPVASAMTSMFLETVAEAVEDRHYPHLPKADPISFMDGLRDTVSFLGVLIVANLLAFALYLIFAPAAPLIFWALNGFLLGREYFTLAAMRRVGRARAKRMRREHIAPIWLAGTLMAIPLTIPILNLVIPILGAATFTHIYHGLTSKPAA